MSEQSCPLIGLPTARSHQLANTGRCCERNDAVHRTPPGVGQRPLTFDLRTVATEFVAMGCTQFPEILPFGNFFPGNEKFFRDPGKSSPVNIPSQYIIKLGGFLQKLGVEVH